MSSSTNQERLQEFGFAALLLLGVIVFALGVAFFILGLGIQAEPPSPYLTSTNEKYALIGLSVGTMVVGGLLIRSAGKVVGW